MEIPVGKCSNCGKTIQMWRCGDVAGGGTYHIVCFECSERDSRQGSPLNIFWRWIGWTLMIGLIIGVFFVLTIFGGH